MRTLAVILLLLLAGCAAPDSRGDVLRAGQRALAVFNTLDHRNLDEGLRRWLDESTDALHEEFRRIDKERIRQAATVTEGRVADIALLHMAEDTAKVIAAVEVVVTPTSGEPATKRGRYQADLRHTPVGWKASAVAPVPISADDVITHEGVDHVVEAMATLFSFRFDDTTDRARDLVHGKAIEQHQRMFEQIRRQAAAQRIVLASKVVRAGVRVREGDRAVLLVFLDQALERAGQTSVAAAQLTVTTERVDGRWRVTDLQPR
ncbi:hypothetical protein [Allokutzneria albata]|uniref:Mce-associated membrane protein n=1 Tax=Allokutzneria albata TaxID=211114 RepID=A0A1G9URH9_ALLAB|nr:hypothetical protein [Allokutzneria albata]SDM62407.1 hypothetical protein SAMN04489726_2566 [Allokutzneria albata]